MALQFCVQNFDFSFPIWRHSLQKGTFDIKSRTKSRLNPD
ncbi:hypothetical protein CCACVL1_13753 [Corchorus capsularis]|uniref:Uncharacterized protein n=1 Tax=Corchorus capsularis TaxID=210143 RepID=A0A1R3I9R8_COCAP|nr:hypothetical protein CCACVL1_13753 [Corchorus capsularis]